MAKAVSPKKGKTLQFSDGTGGGLSTMAAAIARAHGHDGALAATSQKKANVPAEVTTVLDEIGLQPIDVKAGTTEAAQAIDLGAWGVWLFEGEGDLERLAAARIARDKIERRIEALQAL